MDAMSCHFSWTPTQPWRWSTRSWRSTMAWCQQPYQVLSATRWVAISLGWIGWVQWAFWGYCLAHIEAACGDIRLDPAAFDIPRTWGKHRIVLHAFAGRRRPGDFQFYLDRLLATCADGVLIHAVSMDIIYDSTLGDASCRSTQQFWFKGIDQGWVVGFIGGPPCETWSKARGVEVLGVNTRKGPRIIRNTSELWGFDALGLKELEQVSMGNELLLFSLVCIFRLALGGALPFWSIRPNLIPKMLPRYGACRLSSCSHISQVLKFSMCCRGSSALLHRNLRTCSAWTCRNFLLRCVSALFVNSLQKGAP